MLRVECPFQISWWNLISLVIASVEIRSVSLQGAVIGHCHRSALITKGEMCLSVACLASFPHFFLLLPVPSALGLSLVTVSP